MAHILFISPYYPPENGAAPTCVGETATRLVKQGHQVTVLTTFPNYPTGIVWSEYRGRLFQEETRDGVQVVRVWSWVSPDKSFLYRIRWYLSFAFLAPLLGRKAVGHPDLIIVQSPPLFDAIAVRLLAWWKRCPFIFMVSDLWPEQAIQLGVLRNRLLIWLSEWLEWSTYRRAALVWVVTEWIRNKLIQRGLESEHILLLTNGVDTTMFRPQPQAQARAALGWNDRFTVLYVGTLGVTHGLMTIIEAAEHLREHDDIHFVLVGEGADKAILVAEAQKRGLTNITFMDVVPHSFVPTLLAAGDVCLAHVRKAQVTEGILPIKMYEAMACARPIVLAVDGEARRIAEQEAGAAIYVEPENALALATAVLHLREHPELAAALGARGRSYVKAHFDYDHLTAVLNAHIVAFLEKKAPASVPTTPMPDLPTTPMPDFIGAVDGSVTHVSLKEE
jgi:colanic acid biosynthesis glycosyl transferase WcaI